MDPSRPKRHDVVVVGASAGGLEALVELVAGLEPGLPAAVLAVLHLPPDGSSALAPILDRRGTLPCVSAAEDAPLHPGTVTVAPPDRHLLVVDGHAVLGRGPAEGGHRPSADALFRSAARALGSRVIGVVLSGVLDDGVAGLVAVARAGGLVVLQDPGDAMHPGMPQEVLRFLHPDHVVPARELGPLLGRLVREEAGPATAPPVHGDGVDRALWAAYRILRQRAALSGRLERAADQRGDTAMRRRHTDARLEAVALAAELRTLLLAGLPEGRAVPEPRALDSVSG